MKNTGGSGFSLIELIVFIVVISIIGTISLNVLGVALRRFYPVEHKQIIATQAAMRCMEWFLGQAYANGYSSIPCPSTTVPSFCTAPNGYTISVNIAYTTISGDSTYKGITVTANGLSKATYNLLIASY